MAGLEFHVDEEKVNIFSMHFKACTLQHSQTLSIFSDIKNSVQIAHCGFENSISSYAITIKGVLGLLNLHRSEMNAKISFCSFFANNGALQALNPNTVTGDHVFINLQISASVFHSNHRDGEESGAVERVNLTVIQSKFIDNKAKKGGAISSHYLLSLLTNTDVLSLWLPSIRISSCWFAKNLALMGGAIFLSGSFSGYFSPETPQIPVVHTVAGSLFQENHAQEFGGAVYIRDVTAF